MLSFKRRKSQGLPESGLWVETQANSAIGQINVTPNSKRKYFLYFSRRFDTSINIEWNLSIITYYELLVIGRFQGQGMRSSGLRIPPRSWPWYCLFVGRERKFQCRRFTRLFNINWDYMTIKNQNTFNLVLSICFQYYSFYCLGQKLLRS